MRDAGEVQLPAARRGTWWRTHPARAARAAGLAVALFGPFAPFAPFAPSRAWALCPNCLGQRASLGTTQFLIGVFLLLPFVATYVVWRVARRAAATTRPPQ
jgi:hypothetical protein